SLTSTSGCICSMPAWQSGQAAECGPAAWADGTSRNAAASGTAALSHGERVSTRIFEPPDPLSVTAAPPDGAAATGCNDAPAPGVSLASPSVDESHVG